MKTAVSTDTVKPTKLSGRQDETPTNEKAIDHEHL